MTLDEFADKFDLELTRIDGFDDCIVGVAEQFNRSFVVYDRKKVLKKLEKDLGSEEAAQEWFDFNIVGAWLGESTPAFVEGLEAAA